MILRLNFVSFISVSDSFMGNMYESPNIHAKMEKQIAGKPNNNQSFNE